MIRKLYILTIWLSLCGSAWGLNEISIGPDNTLKGVKVYAVLISGPGEADSSELWDSDSWEPKHTQAWSTFAIYLTETAVNSGVHTIDMPAIGSKYIGWNFYLDANSDTTPDFDNDSLIGGASFVQWDGINVGGNLTGVRRDSTAAIGIESAFDGRGYGSIGPRWTTASVGGAGATGTVELTGPSTDMSADSIIGATVVIRDGTDQNNWFYAKVTDFVATDPPTLSYQAESAPGFIVLAGEYVELCPPGFSYTNQTAMDAVKTKTDQLTFTVPNQVDSNTLSALSLPVLPFGPGNPIPAHIISSDITIGGSATSPFLIGADHLWTFSRPGLIESDKVLNEAIGSSNILVGMDFTNTIPPQAALQAVGVVTFNPVTGAPTFAAGTISTNRKQAHWLISTVGVTAQQYVVKITITTTDSQSFVRYGRMRVR